MSGHGVDGLADVGVGGAVYADGGAIQDVTAGGDAVEHGIVTGGNGVGGAAVAVGGRRHHHVCTCFHFGSRCCLCIFELADVDRVGVGRTGRDVGDLVVAVVQSAAAQADRIATARGDADAIARHAGDIATAVGELGTGQAGQLFGEFDRQGVGAVGHHADVVVTQGAGVAAHDVDGGAELAFDVGAAVAGKGEWTVNRCI